MSNTPGRTRLVDLDPHWVGERGKTGKYVIAQKPELRGGFVSCWQWDVDRAGIGITFLCPIHRNHRLGVAFANPTDGGPPSSNANANLWNRTRTLFEELSLTPSIDASEHECWHGFITNGEIV